MVVLDDLHFLVLGQSLFSSLSEVWMAGAFVGLQHLLNRHLGVDRPTGTLVLIDNDPAQARSPSQHLILRLFEYFLDVLLRDEVKSEGLF